LVGDLLAEITALRAQVARLEALTALVPEIESALLTIALHGEERQRTQSSPRILQRPSA
jgi:hypothetical protein